MTSILGHQSDPLVRLPDSAEPTAPCCGNTLGRQGHADIQTLRHASDLSTLMASVIGIASVLTSSGTPFALIRNGASSSALFPKSRPDIPEGDIALVLNRETELRETLGRGEHVIIQPPRPEAHESASAEETQCLVLFPVTIGPDIMVLLCVAIPEGREIPAHELELLHLLCMLASPLVAKVRQVEEFEDRAGAGEKERARQFEERLRDGLARQQQETQVVNHQMRALLLANLAHELRTPLVAIRGYTKMILEGRAGELSATQHEYLSIAAQNADKLVALTDNLSRLTNTQQLRTELFDVGLVLKACVAKISNVAAHKSLALISQVPTEPFQVFGDSEKLGDVLSSLLSNALQYAEPGGHIEVLLNRGRNGEAMIQVSDTGPGIPKELVEKLFDSYKRPRNAAEPNRIGSGLAVVHDIVRLHGGRISVTSKMGEGSTFSIILPAIRIDPRRPPGPD